MPSWGSVSMQVLWGASVVMEVGWHGVKLLCCLINSKRSSWRPLALLRIYNPFSMSTPPLSEKLRSVAEWSWIEKLNDIKWCCMLWGRIDRNIGKESKKCDKKKEEEKSKTELEENTKKPITRELWKWSKRNEASNLQRKNQIRAQRWGPW